MDPVSRLDDLVATHLDKDRLAHAGTICALANGRHLRYGRDMPTVDGYDYAADDTMVVSEPAQLRAMADPFRTGLIQLLRDRARSTQEIAEELSVPKGTVGHHLKVRERAGLIRVVRTRKVRALTEMFYGRTARLCLYQTEHPGHARATSAFSLLGVLGFLPFVLFALPAGVWVDRLRRRQILIVGDSARAVLLMLIPVLWFAGVLEIWQLLVLEFVIGIFTVFFDVAYQSYLPALIEREHLVDGNSKLQVTV